jgi:hypothetical protein
MFRPIHLLISLACGLTILAAPLAGVSAEPQLQAKARVIDSIGVASNVSPDGKVATVLFDNLVVGTHASLRMPLVVTRSAIVSVPIVNNQQPVRLRYIVRGFVDTGESSRAALVVQACGKTNVIDLGKAIADAENAPAPASKEKREKPESMRQADDFYANFSGTLAGGATHHVTFFLLVEKDRDDLELGAALHVDSLEVVLNP